MLLFAEWLLGYSYVKHTGYFHPLLGRQTLSCAKRKGKAKDKKGPPSVPALPDRHNTIEGDVTEVDTTVIEAVCGLRSKIVLFKADWCTNIDA